MSVFESKKNYVDSLVLEAIASGSCSDAAIAACAEDAFEAWCNTTPLDEAIRDVAS